MERYKLQVRPVRCSGGLFIVECRDTDYSLLDSQGRGNWKPVGLSTTLTVARRSMIEDRDALIAEYVSKA